MSEGTVEAALRQAVGDYITALMVDDGSHVAACERHMDEAFEAVGAALRSRGSSDGLVSDGGNEVELHAHKAAYELVTARSELRAAKRRIGQLEGERDSTDTRLTEALVLARDLVVEIMDKDIRAINVRARVVLGRINAALGDLPTVEEIQDIFAAARADAPQERQA